MFSKHWSNLNTLALSGIRPHHWPKWKGLIPPYNGKRIRMHIPHWGPQPYMNSKGILHYTTRSQI